MTVCVGPEQKAPKQVFSQRNSYCGSFVALNSFSAKKDMFVSALTDPLNQWKKSSDLRLRSSSVLMEIYHYLYKVF